MKSEHDQLTTPQRRAKTARAAVHVSANEEKRKQPLFVLSCAKNLRIQQSLLETLGIDRHTVVRSQGRKHSEKFLSEAQRAWGCIWQSIDEGSLDFFNWYRGLLREAYSLGVWFPPVFLLRPHQLERGELKLETTTGKLIARPARDSLPKEVSDCCDLMGWNFHSIVPALQEGRFEDAWERGTDRTSFVHAVTEAWKSRPEKGGPKAVRDFVSDKLAELGWRISSEE